MKNSYYITTLDSNADETNKNRFSAAPAIVPAVIPNFGIVTITPPQGISIVEMFAIDMVWATANAPLHYRYSYTLVPTALEEDFKKVREFKDDGVELFPVPVTGTLFGLDDGDQDEERVRWGGLQRRLALKRLVNKLDYSMSEIREWSCRSSMETTFATGNYLIRGTVRDAQGSQNHAYATMKVVPLFVADPKYSQEKKIAVLKDYIEY